jgi:hypothetical protein
MGLFDWLAGLFGGKADETPGDVADRIERFADRFSNAGNDAAAAAARTAADEARRAPAAAAARQIEADFLRSRGLRPDGRPIKPALGRAPGDAEYVRYGSTLRAGGSRAWRYNNPGYVRCSSRSTYYGALGCDGEFAIFPDYWTGVHALRLTLRDEYPGQAVGTALRQHLPPEAGDPGRIVTEAGLDPAATVEELTEQDFGALGPTLQTQPGWQEGQQFDRDAPPADAPNWIESAWTSGGQADGARPDPEDMDFGGGTDAAAAPSDNS